MRLRNRFTLFFATFAVGISGLGGWLFYSASGNALEAELDRRLLDVAGVAGHLAFGIDDAFAFFSPGDEETAEWRGVQQLLHRLMEHGYVDQAFIFHREEGDQFATALVGVDPPEVLAIGQELNEAAPYIETIEEAYRSEDGRATTELFESADGTRQYKYGFMHLGSETFLGVLIPADHLSPLTRLRWTLVALAAGAAVAAGLIGWRLASGIASRLEVLSRGALRIQRGAMDRPFNLEGEDEIGRLARAMERMRTGIRRRDEQLRVMLSRVAHEIRNPLGGLELFAAAAQESDDAEERRTILGRIRKEVRDLNAIINEFLGFARPGQTRLRLHDVREPVGEAAALVENDLERRGGRLKVDLPAKPLLARADPRHVKRLTLNLLRNAAQAGDTVWLSGGMVHGEVRLSVRDDGPGIARELRDRIFEPFVGDKAQGAGLGLAIVKEMVEVNRGRVSVVSEDVKGAPPGGPGAEFHVYLRGPEDLPGDAGHRLATNEGAAR